MTLCLVSQPSVNTGRKLFFVLHECESMLGSIYASLINIPCVFRPFLLTLPQWVYKKIIGRESRIWTYINSGSSQWGHTSLDCCLYSSIHNTYRLWNAGLLWKNYRIKTTVYSCRAYIQGHIFTVWKCLFMHTGDMEIGGFSHWIVTDHEHKKETNWWENRCRQLVTSFLTVVLGREGI